MLNRRTVIAAAMIVVIAASAHAVGFRNAKKNKKVAAPSDENKKWAADSSAAIQKNIEEASQKAMKFQETGRSKVEKAAKADMERAKAAAEAKAEASTFKVDPPEEDGIAIEPAPGQNDPTVKIRNPDDYMDEIETTTDFIGSHSYENDIKELLGEIDESENKIKGLKLRVVEKENFVDSLVKRESMLTEDLRKDKVAVENLNAHVKALNARVERLKSEKELTQLEAQFHQYSDAAEKMEGQVAELQDVKSALYSKMQDLHGRIAPLREQEDTNMRLSINADPADQTAMMMQAAAEMQQAMLMQGAAKAGGEASAPKTGAEAGAAAGAEAAKRF
eukprot:g761.t1